MNVPLASMSLNNDSLEISKEIKKMLDDRCSSSEFQEYVADMDLNCKYISKIQIT